VQLSKYEDLDSDSFFCKYEDLAIVIPHIL
jgi:hypothetical protein